MNLGFAFVRKLSPQALRQLSLCSTDVVPNVGAASVDPSAVCRSADRLQCWTVDPGAWSLMMDGTPKWMLIMLVAEKALGWLDDPFGRNPEAGALLPGQDLLKVAVFGPGMMVVQDCCSWMAGLDFDPFLANSGL
ncbi:hypothetical protein Nepgr_030070 [Nepenthes gracilis]|uniref:Uncharacterized protein n=1 Tax=Nepenthes gracilis TaxID=150966 RepID=A0AAD3Y3L0_NEPGR|nr:hypothetical protein Nepgr_030070 [Nepenthes gracilis]